jgi:hypothetical protein
MMERHSDWVSPPSLWGEALNPASEQVRREFRRPAILRFTTDSFMDDLLAMLERDPSRLAELKSEFETWTAPLAEPAPVPPVKHVGGALARMRLMASRKRSTATTTATTTATQAARPPKLFQPAHQRYYLVAACLVCRVVGLPDRHLETAQEERASFVVRMLRPPAGNPSAVSDAERGDEYAFVGKKWEKVGERQTVVEGEERLPLSPVTYQDGPRKRRLLVGLIPVGKRETYLGAEQPPLAGAPALEPLPDPRFTLFKTKVTGPWRELRSVAFQAKAQADYTQAKSKDVDTSMDTLLRPARDQIQVSSWYLLLEFANYLKEHLRSLWDVIDTGPRPSGAMGDVYDALGSGLRHALAQAAAAEGTLASVKTPFHEDTSETGWPQFRFAVTDPENLSMGNPALGLDALETRVANALPKTATPLPATLAARSAASAQSDPYFIVRCVFERPHCGAVAPAVVSDATYSFRLASFFDADAPARPIRIALPLDTTPDGLRKFSKNTAFVMSDVLCGQMKQADNMSFADLVLSVLPFPFRKGLDTGAGGPCEGGMVCSFSIPIITIVALVLLIIFVKLLDIIFNWMPFFRICFPLPGLKGKES